MNIEKIGHCGSAVAVVTGENVLTDVQSALDLIMTALYMTESKNIALDKNSVTEQFFVLSSGLAGEILQKFVNYGVRIAIFGDFSHYTSKPLRDFIYESNKGNSVFFVSTKEEAIAKLSAE